MPKAIYIRTRELEQRNSDITCKKSAWDTMVAYVKLADVFAFVVVVVLLFNIHGKQLWSCRDGQLT